MKKQSNLSKLMGYAGKTQGINLSLVDIVGHKRPGRSCAVLVHMAYHAAMCWPLPRILHRREILRVTAGLPYCLR